MTPHTSGVAKKQITNLVRFFNYVGTIHSTKCITHYTVFKKEQAPKGLDGQCDLLWQQSV